MEIKLEQNDKRHNRRILLAVFVMSMCMAGLAVGIGYRLLLAEAFSHYTGIMNISTEKMARIVRGTEMNANNIFDEVSMNLDSPDSVINALKSKVNLNLDVRGYFAAFEPGYFPEKGTWFQPYIYQPEHGGFDYRQVGSARHNYLKSSWYVTAKEKGGSFWCDPYYYYDGTSMSGHYVTFVKPIYDQKGNLACICGADLKFRWLSHELKWIDDRSRNNKMLQYRICGEPRFYTVILNNEGECLAHPEGKEVSISDAKFIRDLQQKKTGEIDMLVNGKECMVFFAPVEYIDWSVAVIVPKADILRPMMFMIPIFLLLVLFELLIVWYLCKR